MERDVVYKRFCHICGLRESARFYVSGGRRVFLADDECVPAKLNREEVTTVRFYPSDSGRPTCYDCHFSLLQNPQPLTVGQLFISMFGH
jgi:hypothetical protein